ncbi:hypothetical protein FGG08_002763 [Glutinoglossum americanum]|uniref:Transmembrane protein n=1 Tax=Glutinoglossum americanum TaxID=1670608 RepID=A0A9P8L1C8_9PEZI|nr:hypothetical protein FGG08_002763 [Glutinoglossum americanum]
MRIRQAGLTCLILEAVAAQSNSNELVPQHLPASFFIHCADVRDTTAANASFEAYSRQHPEVNWTNVSGQAGNPFRDEFMKCHNICLLPFGSGNADFLGIGVFITYVIQLIIAMVLCPIYPLALWIKESWNPDRPRTDRYFKRIQIIINTLYSLADWMIPGDPQDASIDYCPKPLKSIFSSFFDTCLIVSTFIGIASLAWSSNNEAQIFQNVFLNLLCELSLGGLVMAYSLIGRYTRQSTVRLFATFPAVALFAGLSGYSVPRRERMIAQSARPFYDTLGVDCLKIAQLQEFQRTVFQRDTLHMFSMITFLTFLAYSYLETGIRLIRGGRRAWKKTWGNILRVVVLVIYLSLYISGVATLHRAVRLRETYRQWYELGGKPWGDNSWGFGQFLAFSVWAKLIWEAFLALIHMVRSRHREREDGMDGEV